MSVPANPMIIYHQKQSSGKTTNPADASPCKGKKSKRERDLADRF
jgi:hypothetical protein